MMRLFVMMFAVLVCSLTSAFGNEIAPVKLSDAQLDNVSAGFFDININISPIITVQTAINVTTQLAVLSSGYQDAITNASNFAVTHLRINH